MKVTDLIKLAEKALKMFDEYVLEKSIIPPTRVYIKHFTIDLKLSETGCSSQGSSEIVQKPDWSKAVFDFMEEIIEPMPEFKELIQSVAKTYKNNINTLAKGCNEINQSAFWLKTFIQRLIHEKLEGTLSDDSLIEYASLFKSELELSPLEYRYIHYLDGIFLETDSIRINDSILIRKTKKEDLEYTRDIFLDIPTPGYKYVAIPLSILEIDMSARDERSCHEYIDRVLNSLRLYKLGSVYSLGSASIKKTVIWPMGLQRGGGFANYSAFRRYKLEESETDTFVKFINVVGEKLNFNKEEKRYRTLFVSMERYNSALLESVDMDRRLMTAVMGLESLFTLEKDRGENAFKLGIRLAKLLGNLNFDSMRVRALTEESYIFRNKVVHGSYISQENKKRMNEIFPHILNYLRVSLIIFLLNQDIGKEKMIQIIDESTISDIQNDKLKRVFEKDTTEFLGCLLDI